MEESPSDWEAVVTLGDWSDDQARRVLRALGPECGDLLGKSRVALQVEGGAANPTGKGLTLRIRAGSTSNLRAALNSYLRWLEMAGRVDALARGKEGPGGPSPVSPSRVEHGQPGE